MSGTNVDVAVLNTASNEQLWKIENAGNGWYRIRSKPGKQLGLLGNTDGANGGLASYLSDDTATSTTQKWKLTPR